MLACSSCGLGDKSLVLGLRAGKGGRQGGHSHVPASLTHKAGQRRAGPRKQGFSMGRVSRRGGAQPAAGLSPSPAAAPALAPALAAPLAPRIGCSGHHEEQDDRNDVHPLRPGGEGEREGEWG